jgi:hypothetical protein
MKIHLEEPHLTFHTGKEHQEACSHACCKRISLAQTKPEKPRSSRFLAALPRFLVLKACMDLGLVTENIVLKKVYRKAESPFLEFKKQAFCEAL